MDDSFFCECADLFSCKFKNLLVIMFINVFVLSACDNKKEDTDLKPTIMLQNSNGIETAIGKVLARGDEG